MTHSHTGKVSEPLPASGIRSERAGELRIHGAQVNPRNSTLEILQTRNHLLHLYTQIQHKIVNTSEPTAIATNLVIISSQNRVVTLRTASRSTGEGCIAKSAAGCDSTCAIIQTSPTLRHHFPITPQNPQTQFPRPNFLHNYYNTQPLSEQQKGTGNLVF